jgi:CBS domain-containing protein
VYHYKPGEEDWLAAGFPSEGKQASTPSAGDIARKDVPTCRLTDRVGDVRDRVRAAGWDECVVVNDGGVLLGRLRRKELDGDVSAIVEAVMEAGPTTVRANEELKGLVSRMREHRVERILVTDPEGRLIGVLHLGDADRARSEGSAESSRQS